MKFIIGFNIFIIYIILIKFYIEPKLITILLINFTIDLEYDFFNYK